MYSPKIAEDLIPLIYQKGKAEHKSMVKVVDEILRGEERLKWPLSAPPASTRANTPTTLRVWQEKTLKKLGTTK